MNKTLPETADGLKVISDRELDSMGQSITIDGYVPSYRQRCEVCDSKPVVKGLLNGRIAYNGSMCGPCTWGEADSADPSTWN